MKRLIGFVVLALALFAARQAGAATCPDHCTEERIAYFDGMSPVQMLIESRGPRLVAAIHSIGYICDRVVSIYLDNAPGTNYYHVACVGGQRYTVGETRARTVVWPGDFNGY